MEKQSKTDQSFTPRQDTGRPIIFGEVLFDEFEDGTAVLGGAPFNVAWHLSGFGLNPLLVTRVGNDKHGNEILQTMQQWNMDTAAVQIDDEHPTGKVSIKLDQGQPTFNIVPDQAYDNIDNSALTSINEFKNNTPASMLYHGSLALRSPTSKQTLIEIQKQTALPGFVDINLRNPWWDKDTIKSSLQHATWAKLNDVELDEIARQLQLDSSEQKETANQVRKTFNLALLIVTLGSEGAWFINQDESCFGKPVPANNIKDTVGAGDAFSAVTIYGLLHQWSLTDISHHAMTFASAVCEMRGATTNNKKFYTEKMQQW